MKDLEGTKNSSKTQTQQEDQCSAALNFEEELKRQNISTMLEIYKEDYLTKIDMLTR